MSKKLMLLGAGYEQTIIIQHAHEMGIQVIAVDGNPAALGLKFAEKGIVADINNIDEIYRIAKENSVDGVMTHAVEIPHIVSRVAEKMGLPGLRPNVADVATNKLKRIIRFSEDKVPRPVFEYASSAEEAKKKARALGFPLVMKPVDNAGARGVSKIESINEVENAYNDAVSFSKEKIVLLEEFIQGEEISTEAIIVNGKIITTGFADRNYARKKSFKPHFIEDGHTIPSSLPTDIQKKVIETAEKAIRALGINWGAAKGDVILDGGEPKILEMAARTSGGRFCSDMVPLATGINILKPLIQMSLGLPVDYHYLQKKFDRGAAQRFFFPPAGTLVSISGLEEAKTLPGVYDIFIRDEMKAGYRINPVSNHSDRIGHVIAYGKSREEAIQNAERVVSSVRFEVKQC